MTARKWPTIGALMSLELALVVRNAKIAILQDNLIRARAQAQVLLSRLRQAGGGW